MKHLLYSATLLFALSIVLPELCTAQRAAHAAPEVDHVLEGKILDKKTGQGLAGVSIYLSDLKRGAISRSDGSYRIVQLPHTRSNIRVSMLGYKAIVEVIDLSTTSLHNFELEESLIETPEVVVSGVSQATEKKRMPLAVSIVTQEALRQSSASNIIEALTSQPGISALSTGPALAKPIIRGLGYNRVLVMHDGVRQEGQQWGDEHGVEIDPFGVQTAEIVKGPASLMYGSDALAGVVQLLTAHPVEDGKILAGVDADYSTNNGQASVSLSSQANYQRWMWDLRYTRQQAHAYTNASDGYVMNSGFRSEALHGVFGYTGTWGYSQLHLSQYLLEPGMVEGARDSSGRFLKEVVIGNQVVSVPARAEDETGYNILLPRQRVEHTKVNSENQLVLGELNFRLNLGWQMNQRREFGDVVEPSTPSLAMDLQTWTYDLRTNFAALTLLDVSSGVNGMLQNSENSGVEYLIPDYHVFDLGAFVVGTSHLEQWDLSAGLRFDTRNTRADALYLDSLGRVTTKGPLATEQFTSLDRSTTGLSASLGASWQGSENLTLKFNIGRGFRNPNINELSANGMHEGSQRYELGNANLVPENNTQFDLGLLYQTEHVHIDASVFSNSINNFIFQRKLQAVGGGDSTIQGTEVFRYEQSQALLYGAECSIDIHPHPFDWLHFENTFGMVIATMPNQTDSTKYLPFTPAPRWTSSLRAQFQSISSTLRSLSIGLTSEYTLAQRSIYSAYGTETATEAYDLLHLSIQTELAVLGVKAMRLSFSVNNILNTDYQNHLSRLKYADMNPLTSKVGVSAPGRTFVFKLSVPIELL